MLGAEEDSNNLESVSSHFDTMREKSLEMELKLKSKMTPPKFNNKSKKLIAERPSFNLNVLPGFSFAEVSTVVTLLVTRSKEFLFKFGFVKDVDLMTLEMSHEGRRGKKTCKYFFDPFS